MVDKPYRILWVGEAELPIDNLIKRYYRPESLLPLCKACENYGKNYACPPADADPLNLLCRFAHIRLFAAKLLLTEHVAKSEVESIYVDAMSYFNDVLYRKEAEKSKSMAVMPGSCRLCRECARIEGEPCRHPAKLRMSLDAFSLEIAQMAKELFHIELQWYMNKQPEYLTMIGGILENE